MSTNKKTRDSVRAEPVEALARTARRGASTSSARTGKENRPQVVLVLQGGGALGAYQVGVVQALHEAGIEPDWIIGTSIGAINAALIAGNDPAHRVERLNAFWETLRWRSPLSHLPFEPGALNPLSNLSVVASGVPGFFAPNLAAVWGAHAPLGAENAAYYDTSPLADTLRAHVDFDRIARGATRLTVGAVNVESGQMRYFDSRDEPLGVQHIMASGALPPAFPAVRVGDGLYWDGGIYSNTPIEAVLDDKPRRDALIFAVQLWNPQGAAPKSIWQVMGRQKDIQYASRADSHIARQQQIHRLRHVIGELVQHIPPSQRDTAAVRELAGWGCQTTMHIVRLLAPRLAAEDHTKDIDFTAAGIRARRDAGLIDAREVIAQAPWQHRAGEMHEGVHVHDHLSSCSTM
jgi:NTE family protein